MPGLKENKRKCHSPKLMCLRLQPKEKQALLKTCVILKKTDDSLEKIWYFLWGFLCNPFVLSFGCPALGAFSLTQSFKLSSSDLSGPCMGQRLEVPVTKVTGQEDTAEETVAEYEGAGRLFSCTASALFKQTANLHSNIYFHVGGFSPKLCTQSCGGLYAPVYSCQALCTLRQLSLCTGGCLEEFNSKSLPFRGWGQKHMIFLSLCHDQVPLEWLTQTPEAVMSCQLSVPWGSSPGLQRGCWGAGGGVAFKTARALPQHHPSSCSCGFPAAAVTPPLPPAAEAAENEEVNNAEEDN